MRVKGLLSGVTADGSSEPALELSGLRLETAGVSQGAVGRRTAVGVDSRFGHATTVGPRFFVMAAAAITLFGLALRLWNLGDASLWTDEALTARRAQAPFADSLESIMAAGNQGPIYFWSLRLFPTSTEMLLRLPSALLGLLAIPLMIFMVVRLCHNREMALWAGALLAVNPFHVWLSRTARPYAMVFVLAVLISYCFLMLVRGHRSRALWIGFTIASLLAYATHFTTVALLIAQYILFAFMLREKYRLLRRWAVAQIIAGAPAFAWAYIVLNRPHTIVSEWIPRPDLYDIPLTLWNLLLGYNGVFEWVMVPGLMIVTLGTVFGLWRALHERRDNRQNFYWFWLIVTALVPVYLMSRFFLSIYHDRYFAVMLPALLLLMLQGWTTCSRRVWRTALTIVIATGLYTVLFAFYDGSYQRADWRGAAGYVADNYHPGDAILLERDHTHEVFTRYFAADQDAPAHSTIALLSTTQDTTSLEQRASRLWAVYRNPNEDVHRMGLMPDFDPFDPALSDMGAWLSARRAQVIERRTFNGVKVLLLDTRPAVVAEGR